MVAEEKVEASDELLAYMSKAFNVSREKETAPKRYDEEDDEWDDSSIGSRGSSSFFSFSTKNEEADEKSDDGTNLLEGESVVKKSKICIFMSVVFLAISGALTSAFLIKDQENDVYDGHTMEVINEIQSVSEKKLELAFASARALSRTIATSAIDGSESFPFVTLPHFEMYGGEARQLASSQLMAYVPLVRDSDIMAWEEYSQENQGWIEEGLKYQGVVTADPGTVGPLHARSHNAVHSHLDIGGEVHLEGYHFPMWQMAAAPRNASIVNLDLSYDNTVLEHNIVDAIQRRKPVLSSIQDLRYLTENSFPHESGVTNEWRRIFNPLSASEQPQQSYILQPIFESIEAYLEDETQTLQTKERTTTVASDVVGFVMAVFDWSAIFSDILASEVAGIMIVLDDGCGEVATYYAKGPNATYLGRGDIHDPDSDLLILTLEDFGGLAASGFEGVSILHPQVNGTSYDERYEGTSRGHCQYTVSLYSSKKLDNLYVSNSHVIPAGVIGVMASFIVMVLCFYDCITSRRQKQLLAVAKRTNNLISTLFPKDVQRRIFEDAEIDANMKIDPDEFDEAFGDETGAHLEGMVENKTRKKAIADYFPSATIIFADLVGFTAWSSTRDPSQVFELLETLYHAFDVIAKKRRVFKVETVGDCYVAATGLPVKRSDHAVIMARFARDILKEFSALVRRMEETLGPDTADLGIRVGINSGPVTAGVLRGQNARFQLFGDTVNTAARMESNGAPMRIHISQETADLLAQAGKEKWYTAREDKIVAKGKGELQTYWMNTGGRNSYAGSNGKTPTHSDPGSEHGFELNEAEHLEEQTAASGHTDKMGRLVKWNTELLAQSLQRIIAHRIDSGSEPSDSKAMSATEEKSRLAARNGKLVFDEVVEVIDLPQKSLNLMPGEAPTDPEMVQLSPDVVSQLHDFVRTIAAMYRNNPFHNFEHASHVTMSTSKLLARIVAPEEATGGYAMRQNLLEDTVSVATDDIARDTTYGITSDPLTQFASVFVALIHDVDHPGVPNSTLVKEETRLASTYNNRSVAEQNSIDLAWDLFMDPAYEELRRVLYINEEEFSRFRQLVANLVMATDIMDKELGAFRKARWNKAFEKGSLASSLGSVTGDKNVNRKATIVLEHLIQASDVSHTMQHWHIFIKWNERLFHEMYRAYKEGRADVDPSLNWCKSEIGFFDFYVIPLAKKLESCGVFGVSSDEYLAYATQNRNEWEIRGEEHVKMYLQRHQAKLEEMQLVATSSHHILKQAEEEVKNSQLEDYVKNIVGLLGQKQMSESADDSQSFAEEALESTAAEMAIPDENAIVEGKQIQESDPKTEDDGDHLDMSTSAFYFS